MNNPTVKVLTDNGQRISIRIEGGELADGVIVRPGKTPYCEATIYTDGERMSVGSFGGEIWLCAWPHLFHHGRPSAQQPLPITITEAGKALISSAR